MRVIPSKIFSLRYFRVVGLVLFVLIFDCLGFVPTCRCLPPTGFLILTPRGERFHASFDSVQRAINEAQIGSTIYVPSGVYYEHVVVNKTISLVGENVLETIIDGSSASTVITVTADNVNISRLTIQNSGWGWYRSGIHVHEADSCQIKNNILLHNCHNIRVNCSRNSIVLENTVNGKTKEYGYGIRLINSINCTAISNTVLNCIGGVHLENATNCVVRRNCFTQNNQGIRLYSPCTYNSIIANNVSNNVYDGMIEAMPGNTTCLGNIFFHNNFINNTNPFIYKVSGNVWDNGYPSGGNYWSRYNGIDLLKGPYQNETGSDGIGDTPYHVTSFDVDKYPLMHPWSFLPVHNINTGMGYNAVQASIDSPQTLNKHVLWVDVGTYYEHVNVYKALTLIGENQSTTIIDGQNIGTVLSINADTVSLVGFTIRNSGLAFPPYRMDCGVFLNHSIGSRISHCVITNNRIGLYLFYSAGSIVDHNVVDSNLVNGIWLWYSGSNFLAENRILNNSYNFGVSGGSFSDFNNAVDISNTVDGKLIHYLVGVEDEIFDNQTDIGTLYFISCNNVIVRNLNLSKNVHGVFCYNVTDSKIENLTCQNNNYGIYLQDSSDDTVENNYCSNNWVGIGLQDSNHSTVKNNTVSNNEKGISLYDADNNILSGNTIMSNLFGIRFYSSHFNEIFHNNLTENTEQADLISSYQNVWDKGYPSGGNYWSNYNGADLYNGPYQNITGSDGIGDTPYVIDKSNQDRYPLIITYTLTITTSVGGTTNPAPGTYHYTVNSQVQVTAIPNANYLFDHWELDSINVGSANPYTVLMDKDHTLKAVFSPIPKPPVGGYSFQIEGYPATNPLTPYLALIAILAIGFTTIRRKTTRKTK